MAGGEGTRLRPMTANQPKPLLPVVNRPIMEHVLRLLKRHGFDETVVTVQFLAALVRNYFGDGEEFGMSLQYATEEMPLGTAGSVRNAEDALRDEPFLVISGDALTDMDLTGLVRFHKDKGALVTVALAKVPNPLEFGIVITEEDGQIQRFLEKPTWGPGVLGHGEHRALRDGTRGARGDPARPGGGLVRRRLPQAARPRGPALRLRLG
jgi:Nucleoside-diphosphate-sugar pyrophosphorylase involved in lipopolysaccharide biosynthesis/translation initiation factor 2B, gamma/epsilon subunits (eIF-2Bgamma/eIF-2Bepsilon)